MSPILDHPQRLRLANELHARPFPLVSAPQTAVHLAMLPADNSANRERNSDHDHLRALLEHYGTQPPRAEATHFFGPLGRARLKWESHTEFVTYTAFLDDNGDRPFAPSAFDIFPDSWLSSTPGKRLTSAIIRVQHAAEEEQMSQCIDEWFIEESVAASWVLNDVALLTGDFRVDPAGHLRFALFVGPEIGEGRTGRIVQRVCELETYKAMSMLGLYQARSIQADIGPIQARLGEAVEEINNNVLPHSETLDRLLDIAAELGKLSAQSNFRFGATAAYRAIVDERIDALREERFRGLQTFKEFMVRRYCPAMRTVASCETQLAALEQRAIRAAELLRTQVDVERSAQNQELLASMDRRADIQLRLQKTVEGLSVVAISYYAVNLATYLLLPLADKLSIPKYTLTSALVLPIAGLVWYAIHRIRKKMK